MNYRSFGSTGLRVSEIGLGCSSIGKGANDERESILLLNRAFELGINFYDTADAYGYGRSEELIGRTFKDRRSRVIIASKVGTLPSSLGRIGKVISPALEPVRRVIQPWRGVLKRFSKPRQEFSSTYIKEAIDKSLRRLQTDHIDLYQLHNPPTFMLERGEIFETLDFLRNQGKIRFYGVSAETIGDALICLRYSRVSSVQVVLNLLEQEAVKELLPLAQQKKIAIIARVPLARGLLTKRMTVQTGPVIDKSELELRRSKVEELSFLVNESRTLPQAAIQFVLHHPQVSVAIPGTRTIKHLEENAKAHVARPLKKEEVDKIALLCSE
jgi:aryl-alcohol dehydrogenase-like predicted oxidoreductase